MPKLAAVPGALWLGSQTEHNEAVHLHLNAWYFLDSLNLEASLLKLHWQVAASWNLNSGCPLDTHMGFLPVAWVGFLTP